MTTAFPLKLSTVGLVGALLLTGCSSAAAQSPSSSASRATDRSTAAGSDEGTAPLTARMVCSGEVARNLAELDGLPGAIPVTSTWKNQLFTCTYSLQEGPLVLKVKKSTNAEEAKTYFTAAQASDSGTTIPSFAALGIPAYSTAQGAVAFVKDDMTLVVDATQLPATVGPQATQRSQFASTVASFVLACWREHG